MIVQNQQDYSYTEPGRALVSQGQCKAAASVSFPVFNLEEPTAEPGHFWNIEVPLPSHGLWAPLTLQWETERLGKSQLCLKEFLVLWEPFSVNSSEYELHQLVEHTERKFWTKCRRNFNASFPRILLFSNQVWVLKCKCYWSQLNYKVSYVFQMFKCFYFF